MAKRIVPLLELKACSRPYMALSLLSGVRARKAERESPMACWSTLQVVLTLPLIQVLWQLVAPVSTFAAW